MNKVLIFSGNNDRGIIAFCRFFEKHNICFQIVSSGINDLINYTKYKSKIIKQRIDRNLSIELFKIVKKAFNTSDQEKIIILPSSEFLNRYLLDNRLDLEELGFIIPLVNESLYSKISDKYSFGKLCLDYQINLPQEYYSLNSIEYPFVAKPKYYFKNGKTVNEKPIIVNNNIELERFKKKISDAEFYYQEFVGGDSYYLLFYFDKNQNYSVFSQQNLIQQDQGLSIIAAKSSDIHKNEITNKFTNLLIDKKFRGLIMIEVKHFNNKFYMIEANPRVWGPSQLIEDSGMDLLYRFALDYDLLTSNNKFEYQYKEGIPYFWSGGLVLDTLNNQSVVYHNYDSNKFLSDYHFWLKNDIYLREDTLQVYLKESKIINI